MKFMWEVLQILFYLLFPVFVAVGVAFLMLFNSGKTREEREREAMKESIRRLSK